MIYLDAGGLHALNQVQELCKRRNVQLLISGIHTQPYTLLVKSGFEKKLGENAIFQKIDDALAKAEELVQ
jgi:SulP family sulfate permease